MPEPNINNNQPHDSELEKDIEVTEISKSQDTPAPAPTPTLTSQDIISKPTPSLKEEKSRATTSKTTSNIWGLFQGRGEGKLTFNYFHINNYIFDFILFHLNLRRSKESCLQLLQNNHEQETFVWDMATP